MTVQVTLTAKGQITLPKAFRESLSLTPGTRVTFSQLLDGTVVMRIKQRKLSDLGGILTREGQPTITIKRMRR
ncbi:AbrB/MazE/SpoVT family DNA-binding domain-containing protein [Massilia sp. NR 4-1]|uniref:AbrB/MazE/SpoVT family DNA-binding domain-containing protein n=1 Tax=Massilia sp. NR 4-1 TaxID=1678028 RepID=UPI00067B83B4|nr:AbrB/MazE/SpoVT family DNA-binding domain-containing protein [Massilia sp. NR 4-1]AKU23510.1 AbrB family transcriptional regulator [Massilia sp. NR 4-1]